MIVSRRMSGQNRTQGWLSAPQGAGDIERRLADEVQALRDRGAWSESDERYVRELPLLFSSDSFSASPARLELLRALCRTFNVEFKPDVTPSHRKVIGPVIGAVKRAAIPFLRALIGPSFLKQSEFNATVVKLLGELSNERQHVSPKA